MRIMKIPAASILAAISTLILGVTVARAESPAKPAAAAPPVSWAVFSGYKRFSGNCQVCHGPDGLGGTFAPNLTNSLKTLDHDAFLNTVVNGKQNGELAMPSFGANPNVMCYIEDIYAYLKARSEDKVGRGRPDPQPTKPADAAAAETACMGG